MKGISKHFKGSNWSLPQKVCYVKCSAAP